MKVVGSRRLLFNFSRDVDFRLVSMKFMIRGMKSRYWIRCWLMELAKARSKEYSCEQMKCRECRKFLRNYNAIITRTVPEYVSLLLQDRAAMEIRILLFLFYQYDRSHFFVNFLVTPRKHTIDVQFQRYRLLVSVSSFIATRSQK